MPWLKSHFLWKQPLLLDDAVKFDLASQVGGVSWATSLRVSKDSFTATATICGICLLYSVGHVCLRSIYFSPFGMMIRNDFSGNLSEFLFKHQTVKCSLEHHRCPIFFTSPHLKLEWLMMTPYESHEITSFDPVASWTLRHSLRDYDTNA